MYAPTQYEVPLALNAALSAAATDVGTWTPGYMPVTVRAVAVIVDTLTNAAGSINIDKRVTFKSDTGRVNGAVATINIPNALAAGKVIYKHGIAVAITPGQEIVAKVVTTAGNGKVNVLLMIENSPEVPANNTLMQATT